MSAIRAIFWKECRLLGGFWIALLAVGCLVGLPAVVAAIVEVRIPTSEQVGNCFAGALVICGLDALVRREFLESTVDLSAIGKTVLLSSHQIAEVERVGEVVGLLRAGQLVVVYMEAPHETAALPTAGGAEIT